MDYHITFEDGSDAYLAHHGVLGMKWGVRNAETQAKYAGGTGGQRRYRLAQRGNEYSRSVTDTRRAYNARQSKVKQAAKVGLLGISGSRAYNTSRSRGLSRADSLANASLGEVYIAGVKRKQKKAGTTKTVISDTARRRAEYSNRQDIGTQAAKIALGGPLLTMSYDTARSSGTSRIGAAAVTAVLGGAVTPIARYAEDERKRNS